MNIPQKSREEIKAEREAKKAAKAAAKAAKGKNVGKVAGADNNVKNVSPVANCKSTEKNLEKDVVSKNGKEADVKNKPIVENCNISEQSTKTDAATIARGSQPAGEVSAESTIHFSKVATQDGTSKEKIGGKSKAELKAERRAKQEAQRAAKQQLLVKDSSRIKEPVKSCVETKSECTVKKDTTKSAIKEDPHQLSLFKHLYHERENSRIDVAPINPSIHPAMVRLGVQYASKVIVGSNARCVALLTAVKQVVQDFEKPAQADFIRGLDESLQQSLKYLHHCRPLAVSQHNAMRHLKWQMTRLSSLSDKDAKNKLQGIIDTYISEQIQLADEEISNKIRQKISNGNVILIYGCSSLIHKILVDAHKDKKEKKQFRVIVVDGRPWLEGKEQLRRLAKHGIECSYILINALSFIMPEVSKVFLGAHAILANGAVMSRAGTAQVALMAKAFNVPVLVACETHKSSERVQTDSIVYNELGNADELVNHQPNDETKKGLLTNWRSKKSLNLLNITYDVTPADLVTAVVTELAILPCTSVPVILRIKPSEI